MLKRIDYFPGSLHNHSEYSNLRLIDSTNKLNEMFDVALLQGYRVCGLTDHSCLSAHVKVEEIMKRLPELQIIRGDEIYLGKNDITVDNYNKENMPFHFILLAKDEEGHYQLRQLSTKAWKRSFFKNGLRRVFNTYGDLEEVIGKNPGHVIGSSACFLPGNLVDTSTGAKPIESITSKDFVKNWEGIYEPVIKPTTRLYKGKGYKIKIQGEKSPITLTANHQILTTTNNLFTGSNKNFIWKTAEQLYKHNNSGRYLLQPIQKIYTNNNIIKKADFKGICYGKEAVPNKHSLPENIVLTPELMRFFGLFLGDGHMNVSNRKVTFTLNEKEFFCLDNSVFKKVAQQLNCKYSVYQKPGEHCIVVGFYSIELVELFFYIFQKEVRGKDKYIPFILRINEELDMELLFGLLLSDGWFTNTSKTHSVGFGTISQALSRDIISIYDSLQINTSLYTKEEYTDNHEWHHQKFYTVSVSGQTPLCEVKKTLAYSHEDVINILTTTSKIKHKTKRSFFEKDDILYKIKRIASIEEIDINERVYCLNNYSHTFVCGNVIVHNCLGGAIPTQLLRWKDIQDDELYLQIQNFINYIDDIFGSGNFYLELMPSETHEQSFVNKEILRLANEMFMPYIITTDSHYYTKADAAAHETFLKSKNGEREVRSFYSTTYMMTQDDLEEHLLKDMTIEDIHTGYSYIQKIMDECEDYSIKKPLYIPRLQWEPAAEDKDYNKYNEQIPHMKHFLESEDDGDRLLAKLCVDRLESDSRLQNQEHYDAIEECLDMTQQSSEVNNTHWSHYFLNMRDIIKEIWNAGSLVGCGRGSGGGFILNYLLGITQVNPIWEPTKMYAFRFLNPARVSILDIDTDTESNKRQDILQRFKDVYGKDRVSCVATFGTLKAKSAIQTACRGLGYTNEIGDYLASFIQSERGFQDSLQTTYETNPTFQREMDEVYPDVWKAATAFEGLVNSYSSHAGGVIFVDEDFEHYGPRMLTPKGETITQYELHDCEDCSMIKIDLLSVDALDRIHTCLDLLIKDGLIEEQSTLQETYEKYLGVYNIEREQKEMWEMMNNHEVHALFQFDSAVGSQAIELAHPHQISDMAALNAVLRLQKQPDMSETPLEKFSRFKKNPKLWYQEMDSYGLTKEEQKLLEPIIGISYGMAPLQEQFMMLVKIPECGGWDDQFSDALRKAAAKKQPELFNKLEQQYYERVEERHLSKRFCDYVWKILISPNKSYGF